MIRDDSGPEHSNGSAPVWHTVTQFNLNGINLPTEILHYAGESIDVPNCAVLDWTASDSNTTFELVHFPAISNSNQRSFNPAYLRGNNSSHLTWYSPLLLKSNSKAFVRISNPRGIRAITLTTKQVNGFGQLGEFRLLGKATDFNVGVIWLRDRPKAIGDYANTARGVSIKVPVLDNDIIPNGLVVTNIDLDPATVGIQNQIAVAGQGIYRVIRAGAALTIQFTPVAEFLGPSLASYVVSASNGDTSMPGQIGITVSDDGRNDRAFPSRLGLSGVVGSIAKMIREHLSLKALSTDGS